MNSKFSNPTRSQSCENIVKECGQTSIETSKEKPLYIVESNYKLKIAKLKNELKKSKLDRSEQDLKYQKLLDRTSRLQSNLENAQRTNSKLSGKVKLLENQVAVK